MTRPRTVQVALSLTPDRPHRLRILADRVSDPVHPSYGQHLDREALARESGPPAEAIDALERWLTGVGMDPIPIAGPGRSLLHFRATPDTLRDAFGEEGLEALFEPGPPVAGRAVSLLPGRFAGYVQSLHVLPDLDPKWLEPLALKTRTAGEDGPEAGVRGMTPAALRQGYDFPAGLDGAGETIAVMSLGGVPYRQDLEGFWRQLGVSPRFDAVQVGPMGRRADDPLCRFETTMALEWIGAMAPGARLVVYFIDPVFTPDPWAAFLDAVLADTTRGPTVAVTSWSAPERQYYRVHGRTRIAGLLDQAALLGITVLSASGDWGVYDGFPPQRPDGSRVADAPWPHGVFPAVEERVLAVGGTQVRGRDPWLEKAWSAPLSPALASAVGLRYLAGGGGFSDHVPVPAWQRPVLTSAYARTGGAAAVAPYGRGYPDVSLMAWGGGGEAIGTGAATGRGEPVGARDAGGGGEAIGTGAAAGRGEAIGTGDAGGGREAIGTEGAYRCFVDGVWRDDGGGTSLAAPLWACIIAQANQARRSRGLPRLGFVNPKLYALARQVSSAFRVVEGHTDQPMPALDDRGGVAVHLLPGYVSGEGWNPATGLGVPRVTALIEALSASFSAG